MHSADQKEKVNRKKSVVHALKVIGVGPGDPGCLTLRAKEEIGNAAILFFPKSGEKSGSLAHNIVSSFLKKDQVVRELTYPMIRDKKALKKYWDKAGKQVSRVLKQKKRAAYLTLGDPSIYSTWTYLEQALLKQGHTDADWEIIPGIPSFSYGAALLKKELAIGDGNFCVLSMPGTFEELKTYTSVFKTIVIMKIGQQWPRLREWLKRLELEACTDVVSRGGPENQVADSLTRIAAGKAEYLSLAIITKG